MHLISDWKDIMTSVSDMQSLLGKPYQALSSIGGLGQALLRLASGVPQGQPLLPHLRRQGVGLGQKIHHPRREPSPPFQAPRRTVTALYVYQELFFSHNSR